MKKIFLMSTFILALILMNLRTYAGDWPFGKPVVDMNIESIVPVDLVREIALNKAKELWGGVVGIDEAIPCCDKDGKITVYMVPVCIGREEFPSSEEILDQVERARVLNKKLHDDLQKGELKDILGEVKQKQKTERSMLESLKVPEVATTDGMVSRSAQGLTDKQIRKKVEKEILKDIKYGTIIISATYEQFPVLAVFHYLAPYYLAGKSAEKAKAALKSSEVYLNKIYFCGPGRLYFEFASGIKKSGLQPGMQFFSSSSEADKVLVNFKTTEVETLQRISVLRIKKESSVSVTTKVKEEWQRVEKKLKESNGTK